MSENLNLESLLERAVQLARKGTGLVEPNPRVGALVVRDGEIVGEGYHTEYGGCHAEVKALQAAGEKARGADLVVTLEPCTTWGKTEPCSDAILATGIKRVFHAVADPSAENGNKAVEVLRAAGVEVKNLDVKGDAEALIDDFRTYLAGELPWVILKWAMTADGKVATVSGDSKWISSEESRTEVHEERSRADAVLVGRVTIKLDDPDLRCRLNGGSSKNPVRVILDSSLHLEPTSRVAMTATDSPTWVYHCANGNAGDRAHALEALGVNLIDVPQGEGGRLDPGAALKHLRQNGLHRILVEGGPTVHGALLSSGLADWARVYVAPLLVGGITAPGPVAGAGFPSINDAVWLDDVHLRVVGGSTGSDFVVEGRIGNHRET